MALLEWGLTPEYINRRWTEELLALMFIARTRRLKRHADVMTGKSKSEDDYELVTDTKLFEMLGYQPKVVNRA